VIETLLLKKAFDAFGELVEGIGKPGRVGQVAIAETEAVRRDHMQSIRQCRNQVAVLMRRCRKSVE
jgi:hypothetical protein